MELRYPGGATTLDGSLDLSLLATKGGPPLTRIQVDRANEMSCTWQLEERTRKVQHLASYVMRPDERTALLCVHSLPRDRWVVMIRLPFDISAAAVMGRDSKPVGKIESNRHGFSVEPMQARAMPSGRPGGIILPQSASLNVPVRTDVRFDPVDLFKLPAPEDSNVPGFIAPETELQLSLRSLDGDDRSPIALPPAPTQRIEFDLLSGVALATTESGALMFEAPYMQCVQRRGSLSFYLWANDERTGPPWAGFRLNQDFPDDVELFNGSLNRVGKVRARADGRFEAVGSNNVTQFLN